MTRELNTARPSSKAAWLRFRSWYSTFEDALIEGGADDLAKDLVRPVRWSVEIFRFRTVRLDLRENTTRLTQTLQAVCAENLIRVGGVRESAILAA